MRRRVTRHDDCEDGDCEECDDDEDCDDDEECDEDEGRCVEREDGADRLRRHLSRRYGVDLSQTPAKQVVSRAATILGVSTLGLGDAAAATLVSLRADAEWSEDDHPRAEDGKFSESGGGGGSKGAEASKEVAGEAKTGVPKISRRALEASQGGRMAAEDHERASTLHGKAADSARARGLTELADAHARASDAHQDLAHIRGTAHEWAPDEASAGRHNRLASNRVKEAVEGVRVARESARGSVTGTKSQKANEASVNAARWSDVARGTRQAPAGFSGDARQMAIDAHLKAAAEHRTAGGEIMAKNHETRAAELREPIPSGKEASSPTQKATGTPKSTGASGDHAASAAASAQRARTAAAGTSPAARASARKAEESAALARVAHEHGDHADAAKHAADAARHADAAVSKAAAHRGESTSTKESSKSEDQKIADASQKAAKLSAAAHSLDEASRASTSLASAQAVRDAHDQAAKANREAAAARPRMANGELHPAAVGHNRTADLHQRASDNLMAAMTTHGTGLNRQVVAQSDVHRLAAQATEAARQASVAARSAPSAEAHDRAATAQDRAATLQQAHAAVTSTQGVANSAMAMASGHVDKARYHRAAAARMRKSR